MDINDRVRKLEQRIEELEWRLSQVLDTRKVRILDDEGRVRVFIGVSGGEPVIRLGDQEERQMVAVGVAKGGGRLALSDTRREEGLLMGPSSLEIRDASDTRRAVVALLEKVEGKPVAIWLSDGQGRMRVAVTCNHDGKVHLMDLEETGIILVKPDEVDDTGWQLFVRGTGTTPNEDSGAS